MRHTAAAARVCEVNAAYSPRFLFMHELLSPCNRDPLHTSTFTAKHREAFRVKAVRESGGPCLSSLAC